MASALIPIANHVAVIRLGGVPGQREVWRTEFAGRACVTRIIARDRLHVNLGTTIRSIVLRGQGSAVNLPENIQLTIEGYRVAARIPTLTGPMPGSLTHAGVEPRWPQVLDAGLTIPDGFVYITTEWIDGEPLHRVRVEPHLRIPIARGVGRILAALHASNVAYGDLKAENLIIGPNGEVSLIDLDTMREVPGPRMAVPTRDLTVSWAAPEQRQEQQTYLASDLWAFGKLVRELFDNDVPVHWRELVDACWHQQPLMRPNTAALVARLHDPEAPLLDWNDEPLRPVTPHSASEASGDKTQRVEDLATERVPESTAPTVAKIQQPARSEPPAPPKPVALRSCLMLILVGGLLGIGTCTGLFTWWDRSQIAIADDGADEALMALKLYKTSPVVNKDTSQRTAIRAQADAAWETRATPHATAVRALALVWEQGWQDSSRRWDASKYAEATVALAGAGSKEPATWMARATMEGGACRLNNTDATSAGHCDRALDALATLRGLLPAEDEWNWLRVEASWTEVLVRGELAEQAVSARSGEAAQRLSAVLATCDEATPWLSFGPVNALELYQDCMDYAGLARDLPRYFALSDALFDGAGVTKATVGHAYHSAGAGCDVVTVAQKRGDWTAKGDPWCIAVGHAARGCVALAEDVIARNAALYPEAAWADLQAAMAGRLESCRR